MKTIIKDFHLLANAGFTLIPLHPYATMLSVKGKMKPAGKRPLDAKWTTKLYDNAKIITEAQDSGRNLGVRLTATQLVVDVDPRHFPDGQTLDTPDNPLARLAADCGFALDDFPIVVTGSGGLHIYMGKPADLSVRDSLKEDYPGVEFKSLGRQVVAPGSIHPDTGKQYVAKEGFLAEFSSLPMVPQELSDRIGRSRNSLNRSERVQRASDGSREDVRTMLDAGQIAKVLPMVSIPSGKGDYDDWNKFLMAAHFASDGDLDVLLELEGWVDADAEIEDKWHGYGKYDGTPVSFGTFAKIALQYCLPGARDDVEAWIIKTRADSDFSLLEDESAELGRMIADDELLGGEDGDAPLPSKNATVLALAFLKTQPKLIRAQGRWLTYDRQKGSYLALPSGDEHIEGQIWKFLHGRKYVAGAGVKIIDENASVVQNVKKAAMAYSVGPDVLPAWNYSGNKLLPPPLDLMPVRNGLLHLPTRKLLPPTPMFVNLNVSAVDYDRDAMCPVWRQSLDQWFTPEQGPNKGIRDEDAIQLLQEFMGYCLTHDNSQQKFLYVMGPTRSGKSTLLSLISMLLGDGNCKGAEEDNFTDTFGLELYEDAQVIVFGDFRNSTTRTMSRLVSQILKITGGDKLPINRKGEKVVDKVMPSRLLFASNLLPRFNDSAGAVMRRMLLLYYPNSYVGREDDKLLEKLKAEASGVLNWALEGLERLKRRGHFVQPKSAHPLLKSVQVRTTPTKTFIDDQMSMDSTSVLPKDEVFLRFEAWLEDFNATGAVHYDHFFNQVYDNYPQVTATRPRIDGEQTPSIRGLAWKDPFA